MARQVELKARPHGKTLRYAILDRLDELREDVLVVEYHLEMRGLSSENRAGLTKLHKLLKFTIYQLEAKL